MPVAEIIERCQALFDDPDFNAVRAWKEAGEGRKAIGYMPVYVPREIIHAAGMLPVGILGGGDQLEVIHGDAYYQSYICRIPRSTIELGVTGRLEVLDGMLFPSICDVIRNLSGMWQLMFKDQYARYFDVPQNYEDEVGGTYYVHELQHLRDDLAKLAGREITDEDLRASIAVFNESRQAIADLYQFRADTPWKAPTSEVYLVLRAGMVLPVEEHTVLVRDYIAAAETPAQVDRDGRLLRGRRRFHADHPLAARGRAYRGRSAGQPGQGLPAPFQRDCGQVPARREREGRLSGRFGAPQQRRGGDLRLAQLLRSCALGPSHAAERPRRPGHSLYRFQVRRELRPDAAHPRAGRNFR
jgi:benzoyl-CoA reductase subunit C